MIRLVMTDLDGTLLDDRKRVPAGFDAAVRKLFRHGVRVAVSSGREYFNIIRNFPGLEDILLVSSDNSAFIYDGNRLIGEYAMEAETMRPLCEAVLSIPDAAMTFCTENITYVTNHGKKAAAESILAICPSEEEFRKHILFSDDPIRDAGKNKIGKSGIFHPGDAWKACRCVLEPYLSRITAEPADFSWINLMKKGVDKGTATRFFQEYLGITPNECMVFGDYLNDMGMFRESVHSYAMANAHPDLKAAAAHIAPSNQDSGVMCVLRETFDFLR